MCAFLWPRWRMNMMRQRKHPSVQTQPGWGRCVARGTMIVPPPFGASCCVTSRIEAGGRRQSTHTLLAHPQPSLVQVDKCPGQPGVLPGGTMIVPPPFSASCCLASRIEAARHRQRVRALLTQRQLLVMQAGCPGQWRARQRGAMIAPPHVRASYCAKALRARMHSSAHDTPRRPACAVVASVSHGGRRCARRMRPAPAAPTSPPMRKVSDARLCRCA